MVVGQSCSVHNCTKKKGYVVTLDFPHVVSSLAICRPQADPLPQRFLAPLRSTILLSDGRVDAAAVASFGVAGVRRVQQFSKHDHEVALSTSKVVGSSEDRMHVFREGLRGSGPFS